MLRMDGGTERRPIALPTIRHERRGPNIGGTEWTYSPSHLRRFFF
jgi:hypothetical protein